MELSIFLTTVAYIAPLIGIIVAAILIGNTRIGNYQLNGSPTFGFSLFFLFFSILGVFASVQVKVHFSYAIVYGLTAFISALVAYRIYWGISISDTETLVEERSYASALSASEKPVAAPVPLSMTEEKRVLEPEPAEA